MNPRETCQRDFERIEVALPVTYRFMSVSDAAVPAKALHGETVDISATGMLLNGTLPDPELARMLVDGKAVLWLEFGLSRPKSRVRALAEVKRIEFIDESRGFCRIGIHFCEVLPMDREKLFHFLVYHRPCKNGQD